MASARRGRRQLDIWPGFVDALATLLILIIFLLMVFVLAQFFLGQALSGKTETLDRLGSQLQELNDLLALERQANKDLRLSVSSLSAELNKANAKVEGLSARATTAEEELGAARDTVAAQTEMIDTLTADVAALEAYREELQAKVAELEGKLSDQRAQATQQREISSQARAEVALLNKQMAELKAEIQRLNAALDAAELKAEEQNAQIVALGERLNKALASKVEELNRYRSEFFGRLRKVLGNRQGIRIEGDRFVFQSEVLFDVGSAELGAEGQAQINRLAVALKDIAEEIPPDIDWILRVDGHTDSRPIATPQYPSNWELSTARALSVVKQLIDAGIPPRRLAATGFGEYQPIAEGRTPEAFARNRRIELKFDQR